VGPLSEMGSTATADSHDVEYDCAEYRRDDLTRQAAYQSGLQIWCSDK